MSKSKIALLTLAAFAMGSGYAQSGQDNPVEPLTDAELAKLRQRREYAEKERLKTKGLKEFEINGRFYLAINYKNALKKSKKNETNL